jgi:hypothetical protein
LNATITGVGEKVVNYSEDKTGENNDNRKEWQTLLTLDELKKKMSQNEVDIEIDPQIDLISGYN